MCFNVGLKSILAQKNIEYLFHFTQVDNLNSILVNGLLPRSILNSNKMIYSYNDEYRHDNCLDAVCTSIEFPNYKMFYTLRQNNVNTQWAVIALDAQLLCDLKCAYCVKNAGDSSIFNTSIESRMGNDAFIRLFDDLPFSHTRSDMNLPSYYPTNPQAEVLVFDKIPKSYFKAIFFDDYDNYLKYKSAIEANDIEARNDDTYFWGRDDYKFWQ